MRIGLLGGTFNPVHRGHLALAQAALAKLKLGRVLFIPCARPPHKRKDHLAPAKHRLAMLRLALRGKPRMGISTVEIDRGGVSYSVDTLRELRRRHPGTRFYFIIGADSLHELHSWKRIYELFELCDFVTMKRPGSPAAGRIRLKTPWPARLRAGVFRGRPVAVSSSEIRDRISSGKSIRGLVPPRVEKYIVSQRLYRRRRP